MKLYLRYVRSKRFSKEKIKLYVKGVVFFKKMEDIDNNKLMGLLIIAGGGLLLSQEHIKERRKTKTMGASLDKKER